MTDYILELQSLLLAVTHKTCKVNDLSNHLAKKQADDCLMQVITPCHATALLLQKGMVLEASNMACVALSRLEYHY